MKQLYQFLLIGTLSRRNAFFSFQYNIVFFWIKLKPINGPLKTADR